MPGSPLETVAAGQIRSIASIALPVRSLPRRTPMYARPGPGRARTGRVRQQQLAGGGAGGEAVAQHVREHLGRGLGDRGVQCGDAQAPRSAGTASASGGSRRAGRRPSSPVGRRKPRRFNQRIRRSIARRSAQLQPFARKQACGEVERRGQRRRLEVQPTGHVQGERVGELFGRHASEAQQAAGARRRRR